MGTVNPGNDQQRTTLENEARLYAALRDLVTQINGFEPVKRADGSRMSKYEVLHNAEAALGEYAERH